MKNHEPYYRVVLTHQRQSGKGLLTPCKKSFKSGTALDRREEALTYFFSQANSLPQGSKDSIRMSIVVEHPLIGPFERVIMTHEGGKFDIKPYWEHRILNASVVEMNNYDLAGQILQRYMPLNKKETVSIGMPKPMLKAFKNRSSLKRLCLT